MSQYIKFDDKVDIVLKKLSDINLKVGYTSLFVSAMIFGVGFTTGVMLVNTIDKKINELMD